MEQAADTAQAAAVDHTFRRKLKTVLFQSGYGHRETDWLWLLLCDAPSVYRGGGAQYKWLSDSYSYPQTVA